MPSIERRHYETGRITWRVVWYQDGRREQQAFTNEAAAERFQALVVGNRNRWPHGWDRLNGCMIGDAPSTLPTFAEYAAKTIKARQRADARTKADYTALLANHINPVIGDLPLDRLTRFDIANVSQRLELMGRSPKTIANIHDLMSSVLTDAVGDGLIPRNPARGTLRRTRSGEMVFLTPQEFQALLAHMPDKHQPLAEFLVRTGLRWSEATALQVQDVDLLGRRVLHVRRAWKRRGGLFELGEPKTARSRRTLSLSPGLIDLLIPLVAAKRPREFVFQTDTGRPVRHSYWFNRVWKPAVKAANLDKQPRIHDLRHTHASWLLDEGMSPVGIQERLGHENITTTMIYSHLRPGHAEQVDAAIDRALARNP